MANEKFLFLDPANGFYSETQAAVDTYTGAAGALVQTNASGKIDNTLINFAAFDRVFSVRAASSANLTLTAPGASIGGVTMVSGDRFLAYGQTTQADNGIYVYNGAAVAATRALDYDQDGEVHAGDLVVVEEGTFQERVYILATNNPVTVGVTSLVYTALGTALIDAGLALSYSGTTLNVNVAANKGIKLVSNALAIEPNDFAGLGLVDDGADKMAIDFVVSGTNNNSSRAVKGSDLIGSGANQGAKILGFDSTTLPASLSTASTIQQGLLDAFTLAAQPGVLYTAGTGGITKGQLVYVSANDTALPYSDANLGALASVARNAVGIAASTVVAGSVVKVIDTSSVLTGILTGATAGTKYYWTGSGVSTSIPSTLGAYVWEMGTAKNSSDLHVEVKFLKRNSLV